MVDQMNGHSASLAFLHISGNKKAPCSEEEKNGKSAIVSPLRLLRFNCLLLLRSPAHAL